MNPKHKLAYLLAISGAVTAMGIPPSAHAQIQSAGELFVDIDATSMPDGTLTSIANHGTLGGFFEARGGGITVPFVGQVGDGTHAIRFDGSDYMQLVGELGGPVTPPPAGLVGIDPTRSIEVWALNSTVDGEETMVSWGKRGGGPDGSNISFGYGSNGTWGAVGHWGAPDIGWNDAGGNPEAGRWHHLVYTYDGTTTRVYADGVLQNTEVLGPGVINTHPNTSINLAAQLEPDGVTVTGGLRGSLSLAKVRIHDGVLSNEQILNNYNVEKPTFMDPGTMTSPLSAPPTHRYSFNETAVSDANGAILVDSIGGENGTVLGAGARLTGTRLVLPGGDSAVQAYADLPNGLVSRNGAENFGTGEFSIEGWVKNTGNQNWSRFFDFGSTDIGGGVGGEIFGPGGAGGGMDYLFLSAQEGGNINSHVMVLRNEDPPGGGEVGANLLPVAHNVDLHFVMTWKEDTGVITLYENGKDVQAIKVDDAMTDINDVNVWLGRSNWGGDANLQGEYDEIRIYDHVLMPSEVRGNFAAGPNQLVTAEPVSITANPINQTVPELGSTTFSVSASGLSPITFQWYKNGEPISGATDSTLILNNVPLSDNNAQITCVASNFVGSPRTDTSDAATLTVLADTVAPELLSMGLDSLSSVELVFSEAILAADAMDPSKYILTSPEGDLVLASTAPGADPTRVILTVNGALPCGSLSVTVNGVRDTSAAGNEVAAGSFADFFHLIPAGATHIYSFNNAPGVAASGAPVRDLLGGPSGAILGAGATFSGTRAVLPGGSSATAAYVDLPNGLLSMNSTNRGGSGGVTFEGWMRITGARTWSRILDIGSSLVNGVGSEVTGPGGGGEGRDYLMLSAQIGDDTANHRFEVRNEDPGGGGIVTGDYSTEVFGRDFHFAVTWDERTGEVRAYEDGVEKRLIIVDEALSDINDVNVWLGRSNWTADQNAQAEFDEFRVYNRVLTPETIAEHNMVGLENNYGGVGFLNFTVDNLTMQPDDRQQTVVAVDFDNAFGVDLTGSSCIIYGTSDPSVLTIDANGLITAVGEGTANVTARFSGLEEFITITVTAVPVSFTLHPNDQTVNEFGTAVYTVGIRGTPPVTLQWYKNGQPIMGANGMTLTLSNVQVSDDDSIITCVASNYVLEPVVATSNPARLDVIADTTAPELVAARLATLNSVEVIFSEAIRSEDAMNLGLFSLTGPDGPVTLASAQASADPARILLTSDNPIPCGSLTVSVTGVHDVSAAGNVIVAGSTASFYHLIPAGVTHLYDFNNAPGAAGSGSAVKDLVGGADGQVLGAGANFTGDRVSLPGGSSGSAAYVDLPNGLVSNNSANRGGSGQVSLEGWVRITGSRTWSRIFDVGSSEGGEVTGPGGGGAGLDYLMLSAQVDVDTGTHRLELRNEDPAGGGITTVDHASVAFGADTHFAVTWDEASGVITAYENGELKTSMTVDDAMSDLNDVNVWLGRSNWTSDQNMQGEFDQFRVYDRALSAQDVANNYRVGPDNNYGSVAALNFASERSTMARGETQATSFVVDFENALEVDLSGSPCVIYLSSNPGVLTVDTKGVVTAVAPGTASVTARIAGEGASVEITVMSANEAPVANDDVYAALEDASLNVAASGGVLVNDTDADGDALTAALVSGPANGSLMLNPDGSFDYLPNLNFHGTDSFTYKANDGQEDSNVATVTINVAPVNDAPVCEPGSATTNEDEPVSIPLAGSDVDGDALTYHLAAGPLNGTVTIVDHVATYQGNLNFNGTDSFSFKVSDGALESAPCEVVVTVLAVNDAPVAVIDVSPLADLGPTVAGLVVISPNNESACVTLDGSRSSDVDNDFSDLTFVWKVGDAVVGVGATTQVCLPVGSHSVTLIADDGEAEHNLGETTVVVDVLTPAEAVEELIMVVNDSVVSRKNKQPFLATLKTAAASLERGDFGAGLNRLKNAFQNKVQAQIGKENPDVAEEWIRIAQVIVDAFDNPQDCEGCE